MKIFLKKIYFKSSRFLLKHHLYRFHACLLHVNNFFANKRNPFGFLIAIFLELGYMPLDMVKKKRVCPICRWSGYEFSPVCMGDNLRLATKCPYCQTYERHRLFYHYLETNPAVIENKDILVIGIGPSRIFSDKIFPSGYKTLDINPDFAPDYVADLQSLPLEDESTDIVLCFRVLEHVFDVAKALKEIKRILRPDGILFLSVPIYRGLTRTYEYSDRTKCERGPTWSFPDHCWDFEIEDLKKKIKASGMDVVEIQGDSNSLMHKKYKTIPENDSMGQKLGLVYTDIIFKCDSNSRDTKQ